MRPLTSNEAERLKRLRGLGLLDTTPEPHFDSVCRLAMAVFSAPIAIVSLADEDRLRFKACIGTGLREVSREVGLCNHPIESGEPLIVGDALADARFADNPLVTGEPHARFYAGIPLTLHADVCVGALCVIDTKPRQVCEEHARQLRDLAELVVAHLRLRERTAQYETERSLRTTTLESMDQGLIMVDADGIVQVHNSRAQELLGLPPDLLRSNPSFEDVRRHQVASGDFSPAAMASFPFLMRAGLDASLPCYERERPNGTVLEVRTVRLADGGAVRTYTDVTAARCALSGSHALSGGHP